MAKDSRWIRLNCNWDEADWLDALEWSVRACWPVLETHCKVNGSRGRCPVPNLRRVAAGRNIPYECLKACVEAAIAAGEIEVDGDAWIFVRWSEAQESDSAERVRRHRANKADVTAEDETPEPLPSPTVTPVTLQGVTVTVETFPCHATETGTVTTTGRDSETTLRSVSGGGGAAPPAVDEWAGVPEAQRPQWARTKPNHSWLMAERVLWQVHDELADDGRDWDPPTDTEIRRAMKDEGPLWWLSDKYGEDEAVAMFVFAVRNWSSLPSGWDQILSQHRQIREKMVKAATQAKTTAPKRETVEEAKARVKAKMEANRAA